MSGYFQREAERQEGETTGEATKYMCSRCGKFIPGTYSDAPDGPIYCSDCEEER